MPYALRFDGVNDVVSLTSGMTGNVGTSAYTMRVKSSPAGITLPASGNAGIIGTSSDSAASGLIVTSTGQLRIVSAGSNRYGSTAQLIFTGVPFDYTLTHTAAGAWDIYNNLTNAPTGESGSFTTSRVFSELNQFGRSSNSATGYLQGDIAEITVTGLANSQSWQADLSNGAGSTLPTVSGTNNGTLVNFTVPDCWIFYSSGATYQLTALGGTFSYSGGQASLLRQFRLQTLGATYAYSGASANLTYVPSGTVYTLTALGGSFAYSGAQASLLRRFRLVANGGAYAYAGGSANLTYNQLPGIYRLTALGATYTYTGGIAAMTATGVTPMANPGAYAIQAYVGGTQTISAKIGGRQTINAMVAI
jgi:hypothetical protein